jgi:hypothetical protein
VAHENAADAAARDAVAGLIGEISHRQASDIDGWARLAAQAAGDRSEITLIGIAPQTAQKPIDPLGTLSFRVEMTAQHRHVVRRDRVEHVVLRRRLHEIRPVAQDRPWSDPPRFARSTARTGRDR